MFQKKVAVSSEQKNILFFAKVLIIVMLVNLRKQYKKLTLCYKSLVYFIKFY